MSTFLEDLWDVVIGDMTLNELLGPVDHLSLDELDQTYDQFSANLDAAWEMGLVTNRQQFDGWLEAWRSTRVSLTAPKRIDIEVLKPNWLEEGF